MPSTDDARPRRRALLRILAPAVLLLGYADLARGGMTAGPVLLVVAYLLLVPAALIQG